MIISGTKSQAMHQANIAGLSTFQWNACDKCGCTEYRAYSSMMCVQCDRKRVNKYRAANKERCAKMVSNWQKNNREYLRMKARAVSQQRGEGSAAAKVAHEYGLTMLDVATAWGNRASLSTIFNQNETKFRIICAGVKEMSK
jgi:hypothetical protein